MKLRILILSLALAASALTGCIGADDEPVDGSSTGGDDTGGDAVGEIEYPAPFEPTALAVAANASESWVTPGTSVTLTASAPGATSIRYFLADRAAAGGHDAHGGGHAHDASAESIDTGDIAPGVAADAVTLENAGLYTFHCHPHPWMKINVTVVEGAATSGTVHVATLDGDGTADYRFAPDDLTVAPGTEIIVWNNGTMVHTLTQEAFRAYLGEGESATVTVDQAGDWDVLAVARDASNGWGESRVRLVVDPAKPADSKTWDAMKGDISGGFPGNPQPEVKSHSFLSEWDMAELTVAWTATSQIPGGPALVKVTVLDPAGNVVAESDAAASGELKAESLAAGTYKVTVTGEEGALIQYEVTPSALFDLVPPEDYKPGGHDHGGGGEGGDAHGGHDH